MSVPKKVVPGRTFSENVDGKIKLLQIEQAYISTPADRRTPQERRKLALEFLEELTWVLHHFGYEEQPRVGIIADIREALTWAQHNKRHPLLALRGDDLPIPHGLSPRKEIQAQAAAILEIGYTDEGRLQTEWAAEIAQGLGSTGFGQYSGTTVCAWRSACIRGSHAAEDWYRKCLFMYRKVLPLQPQFQVDAAWSLQRLVDECKARFGVAH